MNKEEFKKALEELNIALTTTQEEMLDKFYQFLVSKNKVMNLTRIIDQEDVYLKHFYDSLTLVKIVDFTKVKTLCDVGSGAGFPGVVLKIFFPHLEVILLDALQKRVNYLNELISYLNLEGIEAIHERGETYRVKKFDIVTARAVASLEKLLPTCIPLLKEEGTFIAMKANVLEELCKAESYISKKRLELSKKVTFTLPYEGSTRTLLAFQKQK